MAPLVCGGEEEDVSEHEQNVETHCDHHNMNHKCYLYCVETKQNNLRM